MIINRVLIVEDLPSDAELAEREIKKELGECEFRVVDTRDQFLAALEEFVPDVIIADYMLPSFDGMTALSLSLEHLPDVPFIVFTGSINEDTAVHCMKAGAWDYVIKEHIKRLGPAVSASLDEREVRRERLRTRQALERSERKYHALFHDNRSIILLLDPVSGYIVDANRSAADFYGYDLESFLRLNIRDIRVEENERTDDASDIAKVDQGDFFHSRHRCSNGEIRDVEVYSGPIVIEKKEILYFIVHDITEKMEYFRKLEEARRRAEEASRVKDEFLANISHELRTPLNGIMGMFGILEDLDLGKEGEYWLSMARQSADNLYRIVVDLLDFTRIEAHKLSIRIDEFSIPELMTYILSLFQREAEEKGLELQYTNTCTRRFFSGDRARIAQIVWNLVSNAVKYSRKGIIRIETVEKEDELSIVVEDEGMGIEADRIEDIFEPFRRLENPYTKTHSGVGLGLTFVKNLLELMKGTVTVDSSPGKGSRFEVRIPGQFSEKGTAEKPAPDAVRPENETGGTILVVEDEAINRLYLRSLLKKHSFSVVEAGNGRQAVEKTRQEKPDLVLMDIGLPVMDGLEAARQILQIPEYADLPIIALTAHAYPADRERFLAGGMVDVITKPYQESRLIQTLKKYL